jgi:intein/homing endonuclease
MALSSKLVGFSDKAFELLDFYRNNPVIAAKDLLNTDMAPSQRVIFEDMWFKPYVLITAGRGGGKCVKGDTLIPTSSGFKYIKDIAEYNGNTVVDVKDLSVMGADGQDEVEKWYYNGVDKVNVVKTKRGYSISGTDNHRVLVLDTNADLVCGLVWSKKDLCSEDEALLLGLISSTAKDKFIPQSVMGSSKNVMASFLRGLFECDGSVDGCGVSYCTVSERLAREVHEILLGFGIVSSLGTKKTVSPLGMAFIVDVSSGYVDIFYEEIGFISARKKSRLLSIIGKVRNPNLDTIPNMYKVMDSLWDRSRSILSCKERDLLKKYKSKYYNPGYGSLKNIVDIYPFDDEYIRKVRFLINKNYFFDTVSKVDTEVCETYDLVVPKSKSFVGNGFVNHNTYLLSVISTLYAMLNAGVKVLLMSPSFRQCVVGSTYVIVESKFFRVFDLCNTPDTMATFSGYHNCSAFYKNERSATIKITTESGFILEGAADHRVLYKHNTNDYVELSNVSVGGYAPIFCGGYHTSYSGLRFSYEDAEENIILNTSSDKDIYLQQLILLDNNIFASIVNNRLVVSKKDHVSIHSIEDANKGYCLHGRYPERWIYDKIVSKEYGFKETYDFTVDDAHSYISNGFISHNSKMVFDEVEKRYINSSILQEACEKRPIISSDRCYLTFRGVDNRPGSSIEAYPLGSDGAKIRGLRGHCILADEFAQIPEEIFDLVIRPMGATSSSPMENVNKIKYLKEQLSKGYITEEEFLNEKEGVSTNKIICTSSAYYQFNHMYRRIKSYENEIAKGSNKYATHFVSYEDMPEGFLDMNNIEEAKISMSRTEFDMEYRAIWQSDSDGVFKASLVEQSTSDKVSVKVKGESGGRYIVGVDPARSSDAFAVVVIEVGKPSTVVAAYQATGSKFPQMAQFIFDLCDKFDVMSIKMDAGSGGGGVAIKDLLANEQFFGKNIIIDQDDEEYNNVSGRKILRMFDPNPNSIANINYNTLNILEQGILQFPKQPYDSNEEKEKIYEDVKVMIKQTISIVATETKSGVAHFDIPATGKGKRKKDLYSAFILAASGLYDIVNNRKEEDNSIVNNCGRVIPRRSSNIIAPTISNVSYYGRR